MKSTKLNVKANDSTEQAKESSFPLSRLNMWMMAGSMVIIVLGFLLMLGSGTNEANGFNPDIFSTRRIVVGPIISFIGFIAMGVSIIYKLPDKKDTQD